ncbi:MAG: hypothetical protein M3463_00555 [Verrucomicrobiota bacterium]|nr:hypothetical protein [Verrucomicrobiota bacterium]
MIKLAVLNPRGRDPEQSFPDFAGAPDERAHPPVNCHGFAACTGGGFFRKDEAIPAATKHVIVLVRRDLKACRQAMIELRRTGKTVAIAFKEAGAFQVAALLAKPGPLQLFHEICARADGAIATTPDLVQFFLAAGVRHAEFIPAPYPVEDERWNFARPLQERRGMFLGTREFSAPARNHLAALLTIRLLAEPMVEPVTVLNVEGWRGRRMLDRLRFPEGLLKVVEGRLPYPRYLRLMARHKLVFQLDQSAVPGQVAGDALLCRVPCVGGNGATERLVFTELCGHGRAHEELFDAAARLLEHAHDCEEAAEAALEVARERLSFTTVAKRLQEFFERIGR